MVLLDCGKEGREGEGGGEERREEEEQGREAGEGERQGVRTKGPCLYHCQKGGSCR